MRWASGVIAATALIVGGLSGCSGDRWRWGATNGDGLGGAGNRSRGTPAGCASLDTTCDGIDDDCDGRTDDDFVPTGEIAACIDGRQCRAKDVTCDGVDDDCDGRIDDDFVPTDVVVSCTGGRQCRARDATCDGVDDDCDGERDEDYVPRVPTCTDGCPAARTSCAGGAEALPCQPCGTWPAVAGGWMFFLNAYDFDVAAGKMCLIPLVPAAGAVGGIACTTVAQGNSSPFTVLETPTGFTDGCDTIKCGNRVSLEAGGRVWATRPDGLYRATDAGPLVRVADKPPKCETVITAIEIAGPAAAPRPFVICGPAGGSVASTGDVHEFVPSEDRWIDRGFRANTLGASPSRSFEIFFGGPPVSGSAEVHLVRLEGMPPGPTFLGRIGSGSSGEVGGIYMAATGPFAGGIYQFTGSEILPVSDFTVPLPVENPYLGRYQRLAAAGTGRPAAFPYKIVEGGAGDVGGPSPDGLVDVLWILNETLRVEAYNLGPIPAGVAGPIDQLPLTR